MLGNHSAQGTRARRQSVHQAHAHRIAQVHLRFKVNMSHSTESR
ncbi:hypothetical protein PCAR4_180120 [Paraburkholderia caribensis]|nr:hypothetical protein PCAR4_180120 [Paraburkholderia caribensis]